MLNLHNLTEEVANTQTERAGRMGEVHAARRGAARRIVRAVAWAAGPRPADCGRRCARTPAHRARGAAAAAGAAARRR
jgi:hypothetical protein